MSEILTKQELIAKLEDTNLKLAEIQDQIDALLEEIQNVFNDFSNAVAPVINDYYDSIDSDSERNQK